MSGRIIGINGPVIIAEGMEDAFVGEQVFIGELNIIGEIIEVKGKNIIIQAYEDTWGIGVGEEVRRTQHPLSVELAPGIIGGIFDGLQRPLDKIQNLSGAFIKRGLIVQPLDREKKWKVEIIAKIGQKVKTGDVIAKVKETSIIEHKILVPPQVEGEIVKIKESGEYTIDEELYTIRTVKGEKTFSMLQRWPVRVPRPVYERKEPELPLITGQRVIDFFFPIACGGTAAIPGGFGTGKTVTQHQLAKWSQADIIVYIGCGERGNEMSQVLEEFPHLEDPRTGATLLERTILIANTSNMPVTAREASIYTGITIAEYYRDMGYNVAVMADSTSRWAEALRELGGRLEQMPAEEGFPAYLGAHIGKFYERAGRFVVDKEGREGSITIIGAVSPPGGDFSEPVTQHTKRFIRTFWALDKKLAGARHFPSINWIESYSGYVDIVKKWWRASFDIDWYTLREWAMNILNEDNRLQQIVQLVGQDALPDSHRLILEVARLIKEAFLQQSAFDRVDTYCPPERQLLIMDVIFYFYQLSKDILNKGVPILAIMELPVIEDIMRLKFNEITKEDITNLKDKIKEQLENI